jgi:hypothetical protein
VSDVLITVFPLMPGKCRFVTETHSALTGVPETGRRGKVVSWSCSGHVGETG